MDDNEVLLSSGINPTMFPSKLWHLVNDPQISSIYWDESGEGILICKKTFKAEVLFTANKKMKKYFKTTDFISFLRQLNLYGFKKVYPDYEISMMQVGKIHHFYNPNFKRDNPELMVNLTRLTPSNKAKLAAGLEVSKQPGRLKNSAVVGTVEHQETPYHRYSQRVKRSDTTTKTFQAFVTGHDESSSEFSRFRMAFPWAYPSSPMQKGSHSAVPDEYQCCIPPGSLDLNMPCSQQEVAAYARCGYYPDYSFSHLQYTDQNPNWQAGVAPDPWKSYMNLRTVFKVEDEVQDYSLSHLQYTDQKPTWQESVAPDPRKSYMNLETVIIVEDKVQDSVSHLHCTGQAQNWQSADAPDPRKSHMNLGTVFRVEDEMEVAAFITELSNEKSPGIAVNCQS